MRRLLAFALFAGILAAQTVSQPGGGNSSVAAVADLSDASTVQISTLPLFQLDSCSTTIVANTLVKASGSTVAPATAGSAVLGIARASCVGTGSVTIAQIGSQDCIAEGTIVAGNLIIPGTTDPTKCKDSGTTSMASIADTVAVVGLARAAASTGNAFEVTLLGPNRWGGNDGTGPTGSGDFSSNTATSVDGELVVFSGTAGKTGKRSNTTAAVTKLASGIPSAAAAADVIGLFSSCTGTKVLAADGTCITASGSTYTPGTGIVFNGTEILLDSATQRTFLIAQKTIDFASVAAQTCLSDTITVTGALTGEQPMVTWSTAEDDGIFFKVRVSATDTVTIKACNFTAGAINPASNTFTATVLKTF